MAFIVTLVIEVYFGVKPIKSQGSERFAMASKNWLTGSKGKENKSTLPLHVLNSFARRNSEEKKKG